MAAAHGQSREHAALSPARGERARSQRRQDKARRSPSSPLTPVSPAKAATWVAWFNTATMQGRDGRSRSTGGHEGAEGVPGCPAHVWSRSAPARGRSSPRSTATRRWAATANAASCRRSDHQFLTSRRPRQQPRTQPRWLIPGITAVCGFAPGTAGSPSRSDESRRNTDPDRGAGRPARCFAGHGRAVSPFHGDRCRRCAVHRVHISTR